MRILSPYRLLLLASLLSCAESETPPLGSDLPLPDSESEVHTPDTEPPPVETRVPPADTEDSCVGEGCAGQQCTSDDDCMEGACLWHRAERVCTGPCTMDSDCPFDWVCQAGSCHSAAPMLCLPCVDDEDCEGSLCLDYGVEGRFCGAPCVETVDCPAGFYCDNSQCRLDGIACPCTSSAVAIAAQTICTLKNELGECAGTRLCTEEGLSPCNGPEPATDICDGLDNDCDGATDTELCEDGNPCTIGACQGEGGCVYGIGPAEPCDDGDACTGEGTCNAGACLAQPLDCDDTDPCTSDACVAGVGCVSVDSGLCSCSVDADCPAPVDRCLGDVFCIVTEDKPFLHCVQDLETAVLCTVPPGPDAPCQLSECEPSTGECVLSAGEDGVSCELNTSCYIGHECLGGVCALGEALPCDDNNICTDDACVEGTGCSHSNNLSPCEDGDLCTAEDGCIDGNCVSGMPLDCEDGNPCTIKLGCNPLAGCVVQPGTGPCDDGDFCTIDSNCLDGACQGGGPLQCDDGKECTEDSCDPLSGCFHLPTTPDCCEAGVAPDGTCYPLLKVNAGPDQGIALGTTAVLLGTATGGDGEYGFEWLTLEGVPLSKGASYELSPEESVTRRLRVTDGAGNVAEDTVSILVYGVPLTLCDWPVVQFDPSGMTQPMAQWTFDAACTTATQTVNAMPSVLLSDLDFEVGTLTGSFHVDTHEDDDLIGFVFGYQDETDFYVFDWKQKGQNFCGVDAYEGVLLKHIKTGGEELTCADFFASEGTAVTEVLTVAVPPGWQENTAVPYQWTLHIVGKTATITIEQGETQVHSVVADLPEFQGGRFGFYNNSQDSVVYELFQFVE